MKGVNGHKMKKKVVAVIAAAVMLISTSGLNVSVQGAAVLNEPEYSQSNTSLRLTGNIDGYGKMPVSIVILPAEDTADLLSDDNLPLDVQMAVTDENGSFDITIYLPEYLSSGRYQAVVSGGFAGSGMKKEFSYVSEREAGAVIALINAAVSVSELEKVFNEENLASLAIEPEQYNEFKSSFLPAVIGHTGDFSGAGDFYDFYYSMYAVHLMNNGRVQEALEKYYTNLGISLEAYKVLNEVQKAELERLLQKYSYNNEEFSVVYARNIVLAKVRTASKWSELKQFVLDAASLTGISAGAGSAYAGVSGKDAVFQLMFKEEYSKFEDIKEKFDAAVKQQKAAENSINSSSGGGGGSSGAGGFGSTPDSVQSAADKIAKSVNAAQAVFSDIQGHWAEELILMMYQEGMISGYPDGSFRPDNNVSRAEFAAIAAQKASGEKEALPFYDVSEEDWYYEPVSRLYGQRIVRGDGGYFYPEENIKREDAAVILYNLIGGAAETAYSAVDFPDSADISDYAREAVSALCGAGILHGDENGYFNPRGVTTRAEAVTMMMNAVYPHGTGAAAEPVSAAQTETVRPSDTAQNDIAFEEAVRLIEGIGCKSLVSAEADAEETLTQKEFTAYLAAALGLIPELDSAEEIGQKETSSLEQAAEQIGMLPEEYDGEKDITLSEAVEICMRAANYYQYAVITQKSTFNTGVAARELDLYRDINQKDNELLTFQTAFILIRNTLKADYLKYDFENGSIKTLEDDETVLSQYRGIYTEEGVLTANPYTSLTDENGNTPDGYVRLDDISYKAYSGIYPLIGQYVDAYYTEDSFDTRTILYAEPGKKNTVTPVNAPDVASVKNGCLYWYSDGGKLKNYKLDNSFCFLYNGVAYNDYTAEDFKSVSGKLNLIDNNDDGLYDVICAQINEYMFLDSIDAIQEIIAESGKRAIDLSGNETAYFCYRLDKNDRFYPVKLYDFCTNVPVRVQQSKNGKLVSLYEVDYISGTVTGYSDDYVDIDGVRYDVNEGFYEENTALKTGFSGQFVQDDSGAVVYYISSKGDSGYKYGYLMLAFRPEEDEEAVGIKLFSENGEFESFRLQDRVRLDGTYVKSEAVYSSLTDDSKQTVKQLIRYSVSADGLVNGVDCMEDYSAGGVSAGEAYKSPDNPSDSLIKYYDGTYTFKNDYNVMCFSNGSMGFNAGGGCKVFIIGNDESAGDSDNYRIGVEYISNGSSQSITAFDIDRGGTAGALICYVDKASKTVNVSVSSAIITNVAQAVNEDEEIGYEITYWMNNQYHTAYIGDDVSPMKSSGKLLAPGDVVRLVVNDRSEVTQLAIDFDYEMRRGDASASSYFNNEYAYLSYTWSSLFSYKNNYLLVSNVKDGNGNYDYSPSNLHNYCMNSAKIAVFETSSKTVHSVSISELHDYATYGSDADIMLVRKCYYAPMLVIAYR